MRIASKVSREELEALSRKQYAERFRAAGREQPAAPAALNLSEAARMERPDVFAFQGRLYSLPPIPWETGIDLQELAERVSKAWKEDDAPAVRQVYAEAVRLFHRHATCFGWRGKLKRLLPNPFRTASEQEIGQVLDFFWRCRTGRSLFASLRQTAKPSR